MRTTRLLPRQASPKAVFHTMVHSMPKRPPVLSRGGASLMPIPYAGPVLSGRFTYAKFCGEWCARRTTRRNAQRRGSHKTQRRLPIRAARRQCRAPQHRRLFLSDPPRSDNLKADAQTGIANNGNRQPQGAGRPVGAARMTRAKRTKTIAQHMRDVLTEYGCGGVMWGDVCLLDDCGRTLHPHRASWTCIQ